jgi:hypothetical protein
MNQGDVNPQTMVTRQAWKGWSSSELTRGTLHSLAGIKLAGTSSQS